MHPELRGKLMHIGHGMMRLTSGKMSSRTGNVVTGKSLLADIRELVNQKVGDTRLPKETISAVAVAAIKYAILRQTSDKDIVFDPEKSLSFEGDSGPYLQYAHVRACAIARKAAEEGLVAQASEDTPISPVERMLIYFPEVVERAAREFEPHYLATYLTDLAGVFNSWYAKERIVEDSEEGRHRLAVTDAFRSTMQWGLWLLGIQAPEEM